jgi:hypothetical protein
MKEVLPQRLYYGPPPKSATMRELEQYITLFVNLRNRTGTSHWYSDRHITIELQVPREDVYLDKGRNVKDKHKTVKRVVEQISNQIINGEVVYIHCEDGFSTCGPIVLGVWYWLESGDPLTEIRNRLDFAICNTREQKNQLEEIKEYAEKKRSWKKWDFPAPPANKKREREEGEVSESPPIAKKLNKE